MLYELHTHTAVSRDSLLAPAALVRASRAKGLGRVAVTDHNRLGGALAAHTLAPDLIILGEEIMTAQGELLGYFMREEIPGGLAPAETIARLRAQGAVISVSHPFDRLRRGAWREADLAAILPDVDALEVFNSRCIYPEDNTRALAFAREHAKLGTVGSDAHAAIELGYAALRMAPVNTPAEFLAALAGAEHLTRLSSPFIHFVSAWAKVWTKIKKRLSAQKG